MHVGLEGTDASPAMQPILAAIVDCRGIELLAFALWFFEKSIKGPQIVNTLKTPQITFGRKRLVIWDRLEAHHTWQVKEYVERLIGRVALKHYAKLNSCVSNRTGLGPGGSRNMYSQQGVSTLFRPFRNWADLFWHLHLLLSPTPEN
jgi:hypothetical protein